MNKWLKLSLKIIITALCIWYVSTKIDFAQAGSALAKAKWIFLIPAIAAFVLSKYFSAIRLNIYFRNIGLALSSSSNLRLYWLGMFYNLFLPGSISGDAYKVILLTKRYGVPYKKTTSAVLLDRLSGLTGLGLLLGIYGFFVFDEITISLLISTGALLGVVALYLVNRYWLKDFLPSFIPTLGWGLLAQLAQVVCIYCIMSSLQIPLASYEYVFLFLLSSIVSVLPLTIGGLGIREVVFLEGSKYFGLENEQAVVISILFYLITVLVSAVGGYFVFKKPINDEGAV